MLKRPLEPHCNHSAQTDVCSKPHLFSEIATTIRASCFQFCSFTVSTYFIYSIEVIVHWIYVVVLHISVLLYSICYSFRSTHKSGSVVSEWSCSSFIFLCACPRQDLGTRSWDSNQSSLCKIGHAEPKKNPWGMRRKMMEQEILLKCCSRNPLHDKGMK
jgi:hypothetical protein